jgi:hypothetical protein
MANAKQLADLVVKTAGILCVDDAPGSNPDLQAIVGDPDDSRTSPFAQFKPNPGGTQIPNPLSAVQGDEMFFAYAMTPGAVFQDHSGQQWIVESYGWDGQVEISNRWYPAIRAQVSIVDVRRSIDQVVEPVQFTVPPPPAGVDYGTLLVKENNNNATTIDAHAGQGVSSTSGGW